MGSNEADSILLVGLRGGMAGAVSCAATHPLSLLKDYSQLASYRILLKNVRAAVVRQKDAYSLVKGSMVGYRLRYSGWLSLLFHISP